MRSYKFKRKTDLVRARGAFKDLKSGMYLGINREDNSYFFLDSVHLRTVAMGKYQYLDETYILCSEGLIPHIYE